MSVCTQHKTRSLNCSYLNKFGRYQFLIFASGDLLSYPKYLKCTGCPYDSYHVTVWMGCDMYCIQLCVKVAGTSEKTWMFQWIPEWSKADSAAKKQTSWMHRCYLQTEKKKIVCQVEKINFISSQYFLIFPLGQITLFKHFLFFFLHVSTSWMA